MARLLLTEEEAALCEAVGTRTFLLAREHAKRGTVVGAHWESRTRQVHGRLQGVGSSSGTVVATLISDRDGTLTRVDGRCGCGDHPSCGHPAALVLAALSDGDLVSGQPATPAAWEAALSPFLDEPVAEPAAVPPAQLGLGLQFELVAAPTGDAATAARRGSSRRAGRSGAQAANNGSGAEPAWRIGLRPVVPGQAGWVRAGVSWSTLGYVRYGRSDRVERHYQLLNEILLLSTAAEQRPYYGSPTQVIFLEEFPSRRIWDLLAEAGEIGLPLVQAGRTAGPVIAGRTVARASVRADRDGDTLRLVPMLAVDGVPVDPECAVLVGQPAHGVVWWAERGRPAPKARDRVLRLAPLDRPLDPGVAALVTGSPICIPAADEELFAERYYPALARQVSVVADGAMRLPDLSRVVLVLTVTRLPDHQLSLGWGWASPGGERRDVESLWSAPPVAQRDLRDDLVRRVTDLVADLAPFLFDQEHRGPRLLATAAVAGDSMIHFLREILPRLADLDGIEVETRAEDDGPDYRETFDVPVIAFDNADNGGDGQPDWFDLSVRVTVGGERVPFDALFVALSQDQRYLILPSGGYFGLDRPEFRQLRELIEEARALEDAPPGTLRVGRYQAGLWQELDELGELTGQAAAWQASLRTLQDAGADADHPVPAGLRAELRPYQRDGFGWLAALHAHRLGGVLADDMGLGKTLQALALICHARETGAARAPFLVIAPASVVHNWAGEAARFAPDLPLTTITQTRSRRGTDLAEAVRGAAMVVTSYTLFRLEYEKYEAIDWHGLILDEAQFVKNPAAQGHRLAKRLPVPFKLAITGTPMENNLLELWALLSLTAPGLLPRVDRFAEYYRNPIERDHDPDRLAQLRRRIRPLMLRRRKADVAADLPEKQEQVIELELNPRHRRLYQTYLQRERQKVLGLLGELQKNRFEIFRSLTLLRQASLDVALVDPKHREVPSTKLDALVEQVGEVAAEGHRTLVFSQFTRFLDAARQRLEEAGVKCCYLDGSTRDRAAVLDEFKSGTAPAFLISLKAGGFGLNLTEADYCILLDPWWNPATEAQAVDRVHRIGQTRNVMVYRLVAKDTIEEKVMALKARKAELFSSVFDGDDFTSAALTAADIRDLLE